MTKLLDLIPSWAWALALAGAALGGVSTAGYLYVQLSAERAAHSKSNAEHATAVANAAQAALDQSEKNRSTEQELRNAQTAHAAVVLALQDDLGRARRAAASAGDGVRSATAEAVAEARRQCSAAAAGGTRAPAGDPIGVLADVLGRADARAGLLGDLADRRGIAGAACEVDYDTLYRALSNQPPNSSMPQAGRFPAAQ